MAARLWLGSSPRRGGCGGRRIHTLRCSLAQVWRLGGPDDNWMLETCAILQSPPTARQMACPLTGQGCVSQPACFRFP
jgi:hypothetical protein